MSNGNKPNSLPAALDALEASMAREAEKDATIFRLTAERDAEKKRADAAEHKIYEIAHSGLCSACEQDFEVCQGADDYDDCRDGCPFVNLFLCGEVTGAIEPDGPCAENAQEGSDGNG